MPHLNQKSNRQGFTIVEMIVIVPIVILVIGIFIFAIVKMTGDVLAARSANTTAYNVQDALDRIEQDVKTSGGLLSKTNINAIQSPQGMNDNTDAFENATASGTALILNAYAMTGNNLDTNRGIVYTSGQPVQCDSNQINQNPPLMINIVYFVKDNTLWRRVIMPNGYNYLGCSLPWQQPSCRPGYTTPSFCKTQDTKLVENLQPTNGFTVDYYADGAANADTTAGSSSYPAANRQLAMGSAPTINVKITAVNNTAGRSDNNIISGSIRATSPNNNTAPTLFPDVVANGQVLGLDAGSTNSYPGPGNGTVWYDLSGNNNNATINGATYDPTNGGVMSFDGVNDYADAGNGISLNMTSEVTIGAWIKRGAATASWQGVVGKNSSYWNISNGYGIRQTPSGTLQVWEGSGITNADSYLNVSCAVDEWCYIALTYKSGVGGNVWKNGAPVAGTLPDRGNIAVATTNFKIGIIETSGFFKGYVPVAHVYNRALTASEIQQNFNSIRSRYGL